ncbi:hypothetical protein D3C87_1692990 [compost metagenome]
MRRQRFHQCRQSRFIGSFKIDQQGHYPVFILVDSSLVFRHLLDNLLQIQFIKSAVSTDVLRIVGDEKGVVS